jgi:iron(III) transport system ATP-binding protein
VSSIELRTVSKEYEGRRVVDNVHLRIEVGERVVLFGPSGCGKTTVLHLIAGLIIPDSGEVLVDEQVVARAGRNLCEPERRGIGMVFQDLALWPHMTVGENIEFGLRAKGMPSGQRDHRVREMVELVRLGEHLNARPAELSGGQQQRVALARALALAPRILLMDEPLSTLDDELNLQLREEILRLQRDLRFTLVYVTHSRDEASALGTRIVYLRHGRIGSNSSVGAHLL